MLGDVAEELAKRGIAVTVCCGGGSYDGTEGDQSVAIAGVRVASPRLPGWVERRRLLSWVAFWLWFGIWLPRYGGRFQKIVLLTDPPFLPFWARMWARRIRGAEVVWWTMDLYPEALFAAGRVARDGLAGQLLRFVNELGIRRVDLVVSLSVLQLATVEGYSAFTDLHRSTVIPPWDVRRNQRVQEDENRLAHEMSWVGKRIVLYAGNLGEAHDVTDLVAAARLLRERGDQSWRFVFAVRGSRTGALSRAAEDLPNVEIHDYFPPDRTEELLSAADVHVVSIRPEWASVLVPSKLYGAAATGSPVLFLGAPYELVDDECRSVVLTASSGTNPSDLIDMLEELYRTRQKGRSKTPDQRRHRDEMVDLLVAPTEPTTAR